MRKIVSITKATGMKYGTRDRIRELVRIRDKHTCQMCGARWRGGRRFDVHHLDEKMEGKSADRGAASWDRKHMARMITYCHKCHFNLDSVRRKLAEATRSILDKTRRKTLSTFHPRGS